MHFRMVFPPIAFLICRYFHSHFSWKVIAVGSALKLSIKDENSSNGTKVDGKRITRRWSEFPADGIVSAGESQLILRYEQ